MKLFAVSLYFETPRLIDSKTGSGIVALPEHMTTNILSDDDQFGALMKAKMIHKDKGHHQWHSVAEIEPVAPVHGGGVEEAVAGLRKFIEQGEGTSYGIDYRTGYKEALDDLEHDLAHLQSPAESEVKP